MAGRLEGKVAVITGGGSGIGQACAVAMAREGANIVIGDLRAANETCALVEGAGRRTVFAQTDTTDEAQCEALVAAGVEAFGASTSGWPRPGGRRRGT